jgi:hypothetical protein
MESPNPLVNWRLIFENQLIVVRLKVARCKLQVNQRLRRPLHQALPAYANLRQPMPSIASLPPAPFLKRKPEVGGRQPEEGRMVQRGRRSQTRRYRRRWPSAWWP